MNLVIDIGNTLTKIGVFDHDNLVFYKNIKKIDLNELTKIKNDFPKTNKAILSSVRKKDNNLIEILKSKFKNTIILDPETKLPFKVNYTTPETLGKDRIAAVAGAQKAFPEKNILIIDVGTAVTYEILTQEGIYLGGNISPGIRLRFNSLHEHTDNLPLPDLVKEFQLLGTNTFEAIQSGVENGLLFEIEKYIETFGNDYKDLITILTGGDCNIFENKIKNSIFVLPNLVLTGLNNILEFNA